MRTFVGGQEALNAFEELAQGSEASVPDDFRSLFAGEPGESGRQRAVRLVVAAEVLAELQELGEDDEIARLNALYAAQLQQRVDRQFRLEAAQGSGTVSMHDRASTSPAARVNRAA
ncbi:hypothetical protein ACTPOK_20090 [Streptomyces inhibens]|uniref:hypothetical protein n=1 Tax=Streptomyces inhibens TaxID=2293571 RepID=UPI00402B037F